LIHSVFICSTDQLAGGQRRNAALQSGAPLAFVHLPGAPLDFDWRLAVFAKRQDDGTTKRDVKALVR
jgi:hypothetical protein